MTAGNYVAANGQVRWYFGDLQRNTLALEPAGCGDIVVEVVTRVSTSVDTSVAITGRITGGSKSQTSTLTYAVVGPTLTVRWAFGTVSNTANNVANSPEDDITLTVQARAPLGAVLVPMVTPLVHAGSTLTAATRPR